MPQVHTAQPGQLGELVQALPPPPEVALALFLSRVETFSLLAQPPGLGRTAGPEKLGAGSVMGAQGPGT